ncbi:MAG TPA: hypothetical protein VFQ11_02640 [Nocardioidaceae bacterium]|nr:hypothetical protein [Nocardioidaceae bacterium]
MADTSRGLLHPLIAAHCSRPTARREVQPDDVRRDRGGRRR